MSPARLVFVDETGAATNMARRHGRSPRGSRLDGPVPHGHWKSTTFVGGLTSRGFVAPYVVDGPMNGAIFRAWVEQMLVPELRALRVKDPAMPVVANVDGLPKTDAASAIEALIRQVSSPDTRFG